jgi:nitrile hydratase subunit beta
MNGIHDMGGMHGMGPVEPEANEPVFHADWERRTFALHLAMGAWRRWNIDMGRHTREQMPPAEYLVASYYERWLWGLEKLLAEKGLLTLAENAESSLTPALRREDVPAFVQNRRGARVHEDVPARFTPGDRVRTRNINPIDHTRLPRYVRGRRGVVARDHGVFVFPDTNALGQGTKPQHVYSVRFTARELWGREGHPRDIIHVDLWDDYMDHA